MLLLFLQPNMTRKQFPPKFAIANGFVIGSMPKVLQLTTAYGEKKRVIPEREVTDLLKAMIAPVLVGKSVRNSVEFRD
jgi:hypothetical protein